MAAIRRLKLKHWVILIAIELTFTIIYFGFIWPNMPSIGSYSPLGTFQFSENEWFEAKNIEITDAFTSSGFTVANDELFYNIKYTNKKPFAIVIRPELEVIYGGNVANSITDIDPVTINPGSSGEHKVRFFVSTIGINQILFRTEVSNSTNDVLGTPQVLYNIRVLSVEAFQQLEQNRIAFWGVAISIIVAIASIYVGTASVVMSRRQNQLTMQQMNLQLRPWIGPDTSADSSHRSITRDGFYHATGLEVPDQTFESNPAEALGEVAERWQLWIRNHGHIPAANVQTRVRYFRGPNRPNIENLTNEPPSTPTSLMIGERMSIPINIPAPWIKEQTETQRIFVSIRISYDFAGGNGRYEYIVEYEERNFVTAFTHFT